MAGATDYDYVWIDCEHGSFDIESAVEMIRAADAVGITPLVRVPSHERSFIMRTLDAGAMGVIVPNVETQAQAAAVVSAAKYASGHVSGARGACPGTRAAWHQAGNWGDFVRWSNDHTSVWLIIESPTGVENLEQILAVEGIDAIVIGAFDLAQAMGYDGNIRHPEVERMVKHMTELAGRFKIDVVANMFSITPESMGADAFRCVEAGATILSVGSDRRMFVHALASRSASLKKLAMTAQPRNPAAYARPVEPRLAEALRARR